MTLSNDGKDWIAANLGSGNCISHSSRSFTYYDNNSNTNISDSGSSAKMLNRLVDALVDYITVDGSRLTYGSFTSANGGGATDNDIRWVNSNNWCVGDGGSSGGTPKDCTSGERECVGSNSYRRCKSDGSWGSTVRCASGYHCENGQCVRDSGGTTGCTPGTRKCVGTRGVQECQSDGTWSRTVYCPSGYHCDNGNCVKDSGSGQQCTPGARECVGSGSYRRCNSDGTWGRTSPCPSGTHCENGYCVSSGGTSGGTPGGQGDDTAGPFEVTIGEGSSCPPGDPSIRMDASGGYAFHKSTPVNYLGVGGVEITNRNSECFAYFTWVVKVWRGSGFSTCPTSTPVAEDASRYHDGVDNSPPISTQRIDPGDTEEVFGSIRIPTSLTGTVTLCVYLWGNFNKQSLINELKGEGYSN